MAKMQVLVAVGVLAVLTAGGTGATAQSCAETIGEATAPDRATAQRQAYEAMLRGADENLWRQWLARSQKIGEAPGWTIRKLTSTCNPSGGRTMCRVSAILCRN
jgi:hypothetical protein